MPPLFRILVVTIAALATFGCGGSPFFADVEISRFCITKTDVDLPGVDPDASLDQTLAIPANDQSSLDGLDAASTKLYLLELHILPTEGKPDLTTVEILRATLGGADAGTSLVSYQRDPAKPATTEIVATGGGVNVAPYVLEKSTKSLTLHIVASGVLPASPWKASVKACLSGSTKVQYF